MIFVIVVVFIITTIIIIMIINNSITIIKQCVLRQVHSLFQSE